jgi:hypothetical protein
MNLRIFLSQSIKFEQFKIQAGSDSTGVATDMISVNSSVKFTYRNTGTFFGVHVTSTPLDLSYSELTVASGAVKQKNPPFIFLFTAQNLRDPGLSILLLPLIQ